MQSGGAYYGPGGPVFQIENGSGQVVDTLTTGPTGRTAPSLPLATSTTGTAYRVHEAAAPPGYTLAADQEVTVRPFTNTVVSYTGAQEEPVVPTRLGARTVDAQNDRGLAGAVFDFAFDAANDGRYNIDLGRCTTRCSGICQPPRHNTTGGWLPGWYRVTKVQAPPGYWLDPATAVHDLFLEPGAVAVISTTFGDYLFGSVQLQVAVHVHGLPLRPAGGGIGGRHGRHGPRPWGGCWLVAANGGVFDFGAPFCGAH